MFDFGALPPEINSARMYAGPGSGPMMAAAAAWDGLTAQLETFAARYSALVVGTAGPELVRPVVGRDGRRERALRGVGDRRRRSRRSRPPTRRERRPPPTKRRSPRPCHRPWWRPTARCWTTLVATNLFGQNTPAIAATEAAYAEMWAQDAAAMYTYAGSASSAASLTPVQPTAADHESGGAIRSGRRGFPGRRYVGRHRSQTAPVAADVGTAATVAEPRIGWGHECRRGGRPCVVDHHRVQRHQHP